MRRAMLFMVCVVGGLAGSARAENKDAEELFRSGRQLAKEGNYAAACTAFEKSNELEPNVNVLLNLGDCQEKNQKLASAWHAFVDAEQQTHGKPDQSALNDVANKRAHALEKRLSFLEIEVPDNVSNTDGLAITIDGKPVSKAFWNTAVAVDSGHHEIVARAPQHKDTTKTVEVQGEAARSTVAFAALEPACEGSACGLPAAVPAAAPAVAVTDTLPPVAPTAHDPERRRLFLGGTFGEEEMRGADDTDTFFALEIGYQRPLSSHVFLRIAGGPRYQHMRVGPANAFEFQVNPSIGYIAAGKFLAGFEPTLGASTAGNQDVVNGQTENHFNPVYKLATFSFAYLHDGLYEFGITVNVDGLLGFHSETSQFSACFRYHL